MTLPFIENFASTTFANERWTYRDGAVINNSAVGEPTAPNSMALNSTGANAYDDDEARTNFIKLAGVTGNVLASYWVNRSGVESGETFGRWLSGRVREQPCLRRSQAPAIHRDRPEHDLGARHTANVECRRTSHPSGKRL